MADSKYDDREALALIAEVSERLEPSTPNARMIAAKELLEALDKLKGRLGLAVHPVSGGRWVFLNGNEPSVKVVYDANKHVFLLYLKEGEPTTVPLRFNRLEGAYEGEEEDEYIVPVPGQPIRRRPALAVLVGEIGRLVESSQGKK